MNEALKNNSFEKYIFVLYNLVHSKIIKSQEVFDYFIRLGEFNQITPSTMSEYYFTNLLKIVQDYVLNINNDFIEKVALIELYYYKLFNKYDMKCFINIINDDASVYADLYKYVYLDDDGNSKDKELSNRYFDLLYGLHFCPCIEAGKIKQDELEKWVDDFKKCMINQNQSKIISTALGRIFAYSPIDDDNLPLCEAVRNVIEKEYDKRLDQSLRIEIFNSRGVYSVTDGEAEMNISNKYREYSKKLVKQFPKTALIYEKLADEYLNEANIQRKEAEDGRY